MDKSFDIVDVVVCLFRFKSRLVDGIQQSRVSILLIGPLRVHWCRSDTGTLLHPT